MMIISFFQNIDNRKESNKMETNFYGILLPELATVQSDRYKLSNSKKFLLNLIRSIFKLAPLVKV